MITAFRSQPGSLVVRQWRLLLGAFLALAATAIPVMAKTPARPNIIFILADDLGWGDLASYGSLVARTPHLDRLAEQGVLFEQFYQNASLCSPARAALIAGQFPARNGIHYWMAPRHNAQYGMPAVLDPTLPALPRLMQAAGYRTAHIGKWHVGEDTSAPVTAYGYDEADHIIQGVGPKGNLRYNDPQQTKAYVDRTIEFARTAREQGKPFFVNLWLRDVHGPLDPTEEQLERYRGFGTRSVAGNNHTAVQIFYAAVTEMDAQIGRLMEWIDSQPGLAENTLVVFTSDNGPEDIYIKGAGHQAAGLPGPFRGRKRSLYEGGVRLPLLMRWTGHIAPGRVDRKSVVAAVDFLPTFCALAGQPLPSDYKPDGEDLLPSLVPGAIFNRTKPLFWEYRFDGVGQTINRSPMLAVREREWKLLFNPDGSRVELYNIPRQPSELHSVADKHPEIVARLKRMALAWQATLPPGPVSRNAGSAEYPGLPDNAGRGPIMGEEDVRKLMAPVKVTITREAPGPD